MTSTVFGPYPVHAKTAIQIGFGARTAKPNDMITSWTYQGNVWFNWVSSSETV